MSVLTVLDANTVLVFLTLGLVIAAAVQAIYAALSYSIYWQTTNPEIHARLDTSPSGLRLILENVGGGIAWDGQIETTSRPSEQRTEYPFTRIHPRGAEIHPTGDQPDIAYTRGRDTHLDIKVEYQRGQRSFFTRTWETTAALPDEFTGAPRTQVSVPDEEELEDREEPKN